MTRDTDSAAAGRDTAMPVEERELRSLRRDLASLDGMAPEVLSGHEYRLYKNAVAALSVVHDSFAWRVEGDGASAIARTQQTPLPDGGDHDG